VRQRKLQQLAVQRIAAFAEQMMQRLSCACVSDAGSAVQ
jgi:hypothetical protein